MVIAPYERECRLCGDVFEAEDGDVQTCDDCLDEQRERGL
jgi:Zn finger protein HypA/HybF involved in hydrogenase expression